MHRPFLVNYLPRLAFIVELPRYDLFEQNASLEYHDRYFGSLQLARYLFE